jgi:hypothetical protein
MQNAHRPAVMHMLLVMLPAGSCLRPAWARRRAWCLQLMLCLMTPAQTFTRPLPSATGEAPLSNNGRLSHSLHLPGLLAVDVPVSGCSVPESCGTLHVPTPAAGVSPRVAGGFALPLRRESAVGVQLHC